MSQLSAKDCLFNFKIVNSLIHEKNTVVQSSSYINTRTSVVFSLDKIIEF